jgi:triacylglycerol lipase
LPHRSGAILASAATWVESAKDWASNATFALVPFADGDASNTRVHSGFQAAYERMHSMVDVVLKDLLRIKLRPIWFTGHSLGGALATIAAARLDNATGLYTYGCPRVGDDDFVNAFPAHVNVWRFCTSGDPVPNVPPRAGWFARLLQRSGYQHLGHAVWLDENALPVETGELFVAQKTSNPLLHAPMRYCVLIWNLP